MILTLFLNFGFLLVTGLFALLPSGSLPPEILGGVNYFVGIVNSFSYVIPVGALFSAFALVVSVDIAILLWHFINWVIRKIPGMH